MPVDLQVHIAVRRSTLREGLERLSLPPPPSQAGAVRNWRLEPGKVWLAPGKVAASDKTADLLTFVASDGHLGDTQGLPDVFATVLFDDLPDQNLQGVRLEFNGDFQNFYHPDLDLALLQVYGDWASRGISSLFRAAKRPAFFHILRSFDVIFGHDSSLETVADWRRFYKAGQRTLSLGPSNLLVVGTPLVPLFGPKKMRAVEPFARWELPGPVFVYLSPANMYDYEYGDGTITVVPAHDLGADELWNGPTDIQTPDEDSAAYKRSMVKLRRGLKLPLEIGPAWLDT